MCVVNIAVDCVGSCYCVRIICTCGFPVPLGTMQLLNGSQPSRDGDNPHRKCQFSIYRQSFLHKDVLTE